MRRGEIWTGPGNQNPGFTPYDERRKAGWDGRSTPDSSDCKEHRVYQMIRGGGGFDSPGSPVLSIQGTKLYGVSFKETLHSSLFGHFN